jgi:hypothetical protein
MKTNKKTKIQKGIFGGQKVFLIKKTDFDKEFRIPENLYLLNISNDDFGGIFYFLNAEKPEKKDEFYFSKSNNEHIERIVSHKRIEEKLGVDLKEMGVCYLNFFILKNTKFVNCCLKRLRLEHDYLKNEVYYCISMNPKPKSELYLGI